jgi:cytochrome c1
MPNLASVVIAIICLSLPVSTRAQQPSAANDQGREFALTLCSDCHVVTPGQTQRPIHVQGIPSFMAIANTKGITAESLRKFMRTTHSTIKEPGNMPTLEVTDYQLDQIVDYILSLRRKS